MGGAAEEEGGATKMGATTTSTASELSTGRLPARPNKYPPSLNTSPISSTTHQEPDVATTTFGTTMADNAALPTSSAVFGAVFGAAFGDLISHGTGPAASPSANGTYFDTAATTTFGAAAAGHALPNGATAFPSTAGAARPALRRRSSIFERMESADSYLDNHGLIGVGSAIFLILVVVHSLSYVTVEFGMFNGENKYSQYTPTQMCMSELKDSSFDLLNTGNYYKWMGECVGLVIHNVMMYIIPFAHLISVCHR